MENSRARVSPEIIKALILEIDPGAAVWLADSEVNLIASGAIDSLSVLDLIQKMEQTLHIVFDYNDMKAVHFRTLASLTELLSGKYGLDRG